jgi:hypothetical protein
MTYELIISHQNTIKYDVEQLAIVIIYNLAVIPAPEVEFLDEIRTKVLRVLLVAIHSHLYSFALSFLFLKNHTTFNSSVTLHCKRKRKT